MGSPKSYVDTKNTLRMNRKITKAMYAWKDLYSHYPG